MTLCDVIRVTDLVLRTPALAPDHWQRSHKDQPLVCSLEIHTHVDDEADTDNLLADSLNYGTVTKHVERHVRELTVSSSAGEGELSGIPLEVVAEQLAKVVIFRAKAPNVRLELRRPRALLAADSIGVVLSRSRSDYSVPSSDSPSDSLDTYILLSTATSFANDTLFVRELRRQVIIGLNPCERLDEQEVIVDLEFAAPEDGMIASNGARMGWLGWRGAVKRAEDHFSKTEPLTIESICVSLSSLLLTPHTSPSPIPTASSSSAPTSQRDWNIPRTTVRVSKPAALMFAKHPSVQVTRSRVDFPALFSPSSTRAYSTTLNSSGSDTLHTAYIGLGTNLGRRVKNLNDAVSTLDRLGVEDGLTRVVETSWMYESDAMYHEEQERFLNAVVKIETTLPPLRLLTLLKRVESTLGRDFSTFRNGPRVIDLDLLLYGDVVLDTRETGEKDEEGRWLKVPHQGIAEREFVLRPLVDLAPSLVHPALNKKPSELLAFLTTSPSFASTVHRVFPLSASLVHPYFRPTSSFLPYASDTRTLIMSILNLTPDSFSDGDAARSSNVAVALSEAKKHLAEGADIVDVGGMSTRPGAADNGPEEEIRRVVPFVETLRAAEGSKRAVISIDTFRPDVARAALDAGADIINDVYGGREPGMLDVMAEKACPVILMHSRGDPSTMTRLTTYDNGVINGVRCEMEEMVEKALLAGVRRWNIVVDPGFGFAKSSDQNFALLRHLPELFASSPTLREYPVLLGLSRKRFLAPEKKDAKERRMETAAAVMACVASGWCEVVRVHETKDSREVVQVADKIYKSRVGEA
ncbi:folic acid synthesis protein [Rhodotorula toruloides]|uniref:Folic acid synthesis protein n=1 Tax=Rhodotorula toruloides TaxID=5286 RepID=A0A511KFK7_RHOTO|nr:folic acid synthesis protein [Rhodotorula toruloides]